MTMTMLRLFPLALSLSLATGCILPVSDDDCTPLSDLQDCTDQCVSDAKACYDGCSTNGCLDQCESDGLDCIDDCEADADPVCG